MRKTWYSSTDYPFYNETEYDSWNIYDLSSNALSDTRLSREKAKRIYAYLSLRKIPSWNHSAYCSGRRKMLGMCTKLLCRSVHRDMRMKRKNLMGKCKGMNKMLKNHLRLARNVSLWVSWRHPFCNIWRILIHQSWLLLIHYPFLPVYLGFRCLSRLLLPRPQPCFSMRSFRIISAIYWASGDNNRCVSFQSLS